MQMLLETLVAPVGPVVRAGTRVQSKKTCPAQVLWEAVVAAQAVALAVLGEHMPG
jgi:hypothetical protein